MIRINLFIIRLSSTCSRNLLAYAQPYYFIGRTIPSFRIASVEEQKEFKEFRQALDKKDRKVFDGMFSICHLYNSACAFAAKHHYKQLEKIKEELDKKGM